MKLATIFVLSLGAVAAHAQLAGNLHLVQADDSASGYVNQNFSDFPSFSTGIGSRFSVGGGETWNILNVQQRMFDAGSWISSGGITSALLTLSKFGSGPSGSHDPTAFSSGSDIVYSGNVGVSIDNVNGVLFNLTADTSGVSELQGLGSGDYLVSVVVNAAFGSFGQGYTLLSADTSQDSYARNPGGGFGVPAGSAWGTLQAQFGSAGTQTGLGINGEAIPVPEPASMIALGLGAMACVRRRRK
jgi:hypothetical protein